MAGNAHAIGRLIAHHGRMASDNFVNWKAVGIAGVLAIAGAGTYVGVTGHDSAASLRASRSRSVGGGTTTTTDDETVLALQRQAAWT